MTSSLVSAVSEQPAEPTSLETLFARQQKRRWPMAQEPLSFRVERLERLRQALLKHRAALAQALSLDFQKPAAEVEASEILPTLVELAHAKRHLKRWARPRRVAFHPLTAGTHCRIRPEPKGVVLILGPFNYPAALVLKPLVAALAAGNCVTIKPSDKTRHTTQVLAQVVKDAFNPDEVAVVEGGVEVAQALLALPFDHFFFTGGKKVGHLVMEAAARHLASVTLELGGKSPVIIDEDVDLPQAAERVVWGKFFNTGQTCIAPDYVLVPTRLEEAFLNEVRTALTRFYGPAGESLRANSDFGRLVDEAAVQRLSRILKESVAAGARKAVGGEVDVSSRFMAPTVLSGVRWDMSVMEHELFGPLLPVMTYDSLEDVLREIRARDKPLSLYVFTRRQTVVEQVLSSTTSGAACINQVMIHFVHPRLPFGGVGASGLGSYHGEFGFKTFSHERTVLHQGPFSLAHLFYPPYQGFRRKLVSLISRLYE